MDIVLFDALHICRYRSGPVGPSPAEAVTQERREGDRESVSQSVLWRIMRIIVRYDLVCHYSVARQIDRAALETGGGIAWNSFTVVQTDIDLPSNRFIESWISTALYLETHAHPMMKQNPSSKRSRAFRLSA
jgi:hypothetical protein